MRTRLIRQRLLAEQPKPKPAPCEPPAQGAGGLKVDSPTYATVQEHPQQYTVVITWDDPNYGKALYEVWEDTTETFIAHTRESSLQVPMFRPGVFRFRVRAKQYHWQKHGTPWVNTAEIKIEEQ